MGFQYLVPTPYCGEIVAIIYYQLMNGFDSEPVAMQKSSIPVFQPDDAS